MECCPGSHRVGYDWVRIVQDSLPLYSNYAAALEDVSLVAQGSFDRLERFTLMRERWSGPKVSRKPQSLYSCSRSQRLLLYTIMRMVSYFSLSLSHSFHATLPLTTKVFCICIKPGATMEDQMQSILSASREWGSVKVIIYINEEEQYPINTLRNLVRDHANTLSIFAIDVDFIPGINLYEYLKINVIPFSIQTDSS